MGVVERLDKVFAKLSHQPKGTGCPAIDGVIKEANETASEIEDKAVLYAAVVANSQAVERYEMSRYGTLIAWAKKKLPIPSSTTLRYARVSTGKLLPRRADVPRKADEAPTRSEPFCVLGLKGAERSRSGTIPWLGDCRAVHNTLARADHERLHRRSRCSCRHRASARYLSAAPGP
jgi:Domain of unknown function (DUF892)